MNVMEEIFEIIEAV